jgi:H+/Cl- antiporter ClcA
MAASTIPSTLYQPSAAKFWLAVLLTGIGSGVSAVILLRLLQMVQHAMWPDPDANLLNAAAHASPLRHILVLLGAGVLTGAGQLVLVRLSSANSIDITEAIWFSAGRLPALRTLGSAALSVIIVGMGASLGREGAPKQAGAVTANALSDKMHYQMNNAGCSLHAARGLVWRLPTACHWVALCLRWKSCAGHWPCGWFCPRSLPP